MATKKKTTAPEAEVNDTPAQDPEAQAPAQTPAPEPNPAQTPAPEAAPEFPYQAEIIPPVVIVRAGPGESFEATMTVRKGGIYTIAEENDGWGRLANGAGWIKLTRVQAVKAE